MAVQTIYLLATTAVTPTWWGNTQLNGSAPTAANTAYGWVPGTTALTTAFRRGRLGATTTGTDTAIAASYNAATSGPTPGTGSGATTAGDSFISGPFVGTFANTAWTFNFNVRAGVAGARGHINMQVWKSANANGSSPTQLLANTAGATIILSTSADVNSSVSWSPGALSLYNEYLFFQVEWQETTVGTSGTNNVFFRVGTSSITTPDFQPLPTITGTVGGVTDTNTVLLVHADGTNGSTTFTDSSTYAHTLTASGGAKITTAASQFGTGSMDFTDPSGAAQIDVVGTASDFQFGTQPFTVETWAYFTTLPGSTEAVIVDQWGATITNWSFILGWFSGALNFVYGVNVVFLASSYTTPPLNTWIHIAADRDASSNLRIYVNGSVVLGPTSVPSFDNTNPVDLIIGTQGSGSNAPFPGYLDELRITKGIARYAGAFTPPTAPFGGGGALAQGAQTLSAAGTVGAAGAITGTLNVTQQAQTIAASGAPRVGGTLAVTQAFQSLVAAGSLGVTGTLGVAQAPQTLLALGGPRITGSLVVTQAPQTLAAAGSPRVGGTLGVTQASQTLAATGVVGNPLITGSLITNQAPQTLMAAGILNNLGAQARAMVLA